MDSKCVHLNYRVKYDPLVNKIQTVYNISPIAEGGMIYAEDYFAGLGYRSPGFMDVADVLQLLATPDGAALYDPSEDESLSSVPYTCWLS